MAEKKPKNILEIIFEDKNLLRKFIKLDNQMLFLATLSEAIASCAIEGITADKKKVLEVCLDEEIKQQKAATQCTRCIALRCVAFG
jgi:hypothetical protein